MADAVVRGYLEMAEAAWAGSMRAYVASLEQHLDALRPLIGTDERTCTVCGRTNFAPDGVHQYGLWLTVGDVSYCAEHRPRG